MSSIDLVLRSALLRASRRTAPGKIESVSILRDAVLRTAPQDEINGFRPARLIGFHGDPLELHRNELVVVDRLGVGDGGQGTQFLERGTDDVDRLRIPG